jgi:hypothetical protein
MSDTDPHFTTSDDAGVQLALRRFITAKDVLANGRRKPVLLLHGASANHQTFTIPRAHLPSLADWLVKKGFDPWLLDWRGSGLVVDDPDNRSSLNDPKRSIGYNFNRAARRDVRGPRGATFEMRSISSAVAPRRRRSPRLASAWEAPSSPSQSPWGISPVSMLTAWL